MYKQYMVQALRLFFLSLFTLILSFSTAWAETDPSSRVMQLNYFDGPVTFSPAGSDDWAYAYLNRPLTSGDRIWTDRNARSEMHVGSTTLQMNNQTSLQINTLTDDATQLQLTQGTLNVRVRTLADNEFFEINTPNFAFTVDQPGNYQIDVNPDNNTSTIIVRNGSGTLHGENDTSYTVDGLQKLVFTDTDLHQIGADNTPSTNSFDQWVNERNRKEDQSQSARYISPEITGYSELDRYGTWREEPQYGAIWTPTITVTDWAPYRYGHWTWVNPWGWTWVDDAPWGFAPSHYGRWIWIQNSWAWVPGPRIIHPVYAPALVAFISTQDISARIQASSPAVAWFPLAPGEAYHPIYPVSRGYFTHLNQSTHIHNTVINNSVTHVYINQQAPHAVTAVSTSNFISGQPIHKAIIHVPTMRMPVSITSAPTIKPTQQSLIGHSSFARTAPPHAIFNRTIIATRNLVQTHSNAPSMAHSSAPVSSNIPATTHSLTTPSPHPTPHIVIVGSHESTKNHQPHIHPFPPSTSPTPTTHKDTLHESASPHTLPQSLPSTLSSKHPEKIEHTPPQKHEEQPVSTTSSHAEPPKQHDIPHPPKEFPNIIHPDTPHEKPVNAPRKEAPHHEELIPSHPAPQPHHEDRKHDESPLRHEPKPPMPPHRENLLHGDHHDHHEEHPHPNNHQEHGGHN